MNHQNTPQGTLVLEYLEKYPNHPSKSIARFLFEQHPLLFHSIEYARSSVRAYRGQNGNRDREVIKNRRFYKPAGSCADTGIPLPEPIVELNPWCVVPIDFKRALVISDIHIPYHNPQAVNLAVGYGKNFNVDCVIINGDEVDFHSISFWERNPERRDLSKELEAGKLFLEWLRDKFPKAQIIFHEGNHEERLWRWLWQKVPEFANMPELSLESVLDLKEYGISLVADKKPLLAGDHLYILHGHEFRAPFVNPVSPSRGLYLRASANAICGDLHQTSQFSKAGIDKVISCWSTGCLCDLHPRYNPMNYWNLGFATIEIYKSGLWTVDNKKIINGAIV